MRTPVRVLDISVQASTVCAMAFSMALDCCFAAKGMNERSLLIGMSENSDAVVVIVSEETGTISVGFTTVTT